jgi:tetraprenyl-beta-curcumene synthase
MGNRRSGPPDDNLLSFASIFQLSWQHAFSVLPVTAKELDDKWTPRAGSIPDPELRKQALASISNKRFHAEGGSAYALTHQGVSPVLVQAIVAIQTISDYLDNLCDRSTSGDPRDFRQLHEAYLDAFATDGRSHDYYRLHHECEDGGYLLSLVRETQTRLASLPSYPIVEKQVSRLAKLYTDLQVYKHQLPLESRVPALESWFKEDWPGSDLYWWEFAAASGSTLGIFALLRAAFKPALEAWEASAICDAYFPSICGTHILLDYFIDQAEDISGGDLNLVSYYSSPAERRDRLSLLLRIALQRASKLPDPAFHKWIVSGLPAMYLADPKVRQQKLGKLSKDLLRETGRSGHALQLMVKLHKRFG